MPCVFPSLTVMLHLVVMLPRHETPDDLPADLRGRWERFVARVAAHEQRHVDIYLEGAKAMKARLEATRTGVSCADLEKAIDAAWRAQQADIERAQVEFHAVDETTARSEREALQARLDGTRARLEPVDAEIRRLDTELADLRRQVDAGRARTSSRSTTPCRAARALAEECNRLVADANGLIDAPQLGALVNVSGPRAPPRYRRRYRNLPREAASAYRTVDTVDDCLNRHDPAFLAVAVAGAHDRVDRFAHDDARRKVERDFVRGPRTAVSAVTSQIRTRIRSLHITARIAGERAQERRGDSRTPLLRSVRKMVGRDGLRIRRRQDFQV